MASRHSPRRKDVHQALSFVQIMSPVAKCVLGGLGYV